MGALSVYEVIIRDCRDKDSDMPESSLGCYFSVVDALNYLRHYLKTEHEPFITYYRIVETDTGRVVEEQERNL